MVVRIPLVMYFTQALFLFCTLPKLLQGKSIKSYGYIICSACFVLISLLSMFCSSDFENSLSSVISILQVFLIAVFLFIGCNSEKEYQLVVSVFSKLGWIFMAYIVVATSPQEWRQIFAINTNLSATSGRLGPSVGMHTNMCGTVLSILILFSMYFYFTRKKKSDLLQAVLLVFCLFLTKSRMSLLVTVCGVGLYFSIYKRLGGKQFIKIAAMICLLVAWMIASLSNDFLYNLYGNRLESLLFLFQEKSNTDASVTGRLALQQRAIEVFLQHPIIGVGIGNFRSYSYGLGGVSGYYAHNNYLELLADVGILGTLFYYLPYLVALVKTRAIAKDADGDKRMFFSLLFVLLVMRLVSDYAQVSYLYDSGQILLALAYIGFKMERMSKTKLWVN